MQALVVVLVASIYPNLKYAVGRVVCILEQWLISVAYFSCTKSFLFSIHSLGTLWIPFYLHAFFILMLQHNTLSTRWQTRNSCHRHCFPYLSPSITTLTEAQAAEHGGTSRSRQKNDFKLSAPITLLEAWLVFNVYRLVSRWRRRC